jgi:hypothetical protein
MDQVYWEIIQKFILLVIGVVLPPVLVLLTREAQKVSNALVERIQGEIGMSNYAMVQSMVKEAVLAAEQLGLTEQIENVGEQKKRFAMNYVQGLLEARGIEINLNEIEGAIEAAVKDTFN